MSIPFILYVILGPLSWALMLVLLFLGRRRMTRLLGMHPVLPHPPPAVTVLVPAKDEGEGIGRCLDDILDQDYPRFRVIAINDRSTDRTGTILNELAARHPDRLTVLHVQPGELPEGWLGKCNALWLGSRQADGDWLLFVDSDVTLQPSALSHAVGLCLMRKYDVLTILTRLVCTSRLEQLVLPLAAGAWAVMHTISLTNEDRRTNIALANGQFFFIRRSAYEAIGGHESVRDQITEDVELMRLLKGRGFRTRFMLGSHLAATRMHSSLHQMFHGWARIYSGSARRRPWRILGAIAFLVLCGFSVYPALAWGVVEAIKNTEFAWFVAACGHLLLMTAYLSLIYYWSGNRARDAWLFPAAGAILLGILGFALQTCKTGRVTWRQTEFRIPVHASSSHASRRSR